MINLILALGVITAFLALIMKNLTVSVICLAIFSLLTALLYYLFHAPDVALTEAAVGAGLSTFIFMWVARKTDEMEGCG
jgi:uncharacterized MnhB-related membrane protein